ncbi:MAG: hypothetical protein H6707_14460 [Deltaproteobacteria bacterium]|nr:hypothetical protein [Deltaproteobacteria bacterium]
MSARDLTLVIFSLCWGCGAPPADGTGAPLGKAERVFSDPAYLVRVASTFPRCDRHALLLPNDRFASKPDAFRCRNEAAIAGPWLADAGPTDAGTDAAAASSPGKRYDDQMWIFGIYRPKSFEVCRIQFAADGHKSLILDNTARQTVALSLDDATARLAIAHGDADSPVRIEVIKKLLRYVSVGNLSAAIKLTLQLPASPLAAEEMVRASWYQEVFDGKIKLIGSITDAIAKARQKTMRVPNEERHSYQAVAASTAAVGCGKVKDAFDDYWNY